MSGEKSEKTNKKSKNESFIMKPKVDFCFKELMTDEEIRHGFISALLGVKPEEIVHTELLPTHLRKEHKEDKLGILDFKLFPEDSEFYSRFHLWEDDRRRMYSDKLEIHIIELPKLENKRHPETELLKWARFLNAESREEMTLAANTDPYITKAYEKLVNISADDVKRLEYEAREKAIRDYNWQMKTDYRQGKRDGIAEGEVIGMRESVLTLLAGKGLIPETVREKIQKEQNLEQLKIWLQLASRVESVEAFTKEMPE